MFFLSWLTALGSGMGSVCFRILTLSPVKMDWSIFSVVEWTLVNRMSAGILSPTKERERERGRERSCRVMWRIERERTVEHERERESFCQSINYSSYNCFLQLFSAHLQLPRCLRVPVPWPWWWPLPHSLAAPPWPTLAHTPSVPQLLTQHFSPTQQQTKLQCILATINTSSVYKWLPAMVKIHLQVQEQLSFHFLPSRVTGNCPHM